MRRFQASRSSLGWLRERDIDLLFALTINTQRNVQNWLANKAGFSDVEFVGCSVSVTDAFGEVDLWAEYREGVSSKHILIENKITASFQFEQPERYLKRASQLTLEGDECRTVLFAPESYVSQPSEFNIFVSYESFRHLLANLGGPTNAFIISAIDTAIEMKASGYQAVVDDNSTSTWNQIWKIANAYYPELNMPKPLGKPSSSNWIYFRNAVGFNSSASGRCVLVYKAERGHVDLQFKATRVDDLDSALQNLRTPLPEVANTYQASKSASIRVQVPKLSFLDPAANSLDKIKAGLTACHELRKFYLANGDLIINQLS